MNSSTGHPRASVLAVKNILMQDWDPIGVNGMSGADDEYDSYVPELFSMLKSGASVDEVFDYLVWAEEECMGLNGNRQHALAIAEKLLGLKF